MIIVRCGGATAGSSVSSKPTRVEVRRSIKTSTPVLLVTTNAFAVFDSKISGEPAFTTDGKNRQEPSLLDRGKDKTSKGSRKRCGERPSLDQSILLEAGVRIAPHTKWSSANTQRPGPANEQHDHSVSYA